MEIKKEQHATKSHKIIQSVDRALSILELFTTEKSEWGVSEIARELSLNKSTTFGLISTLEKRRFLEKSDDGQRYRLGFKVVDLSAARLSSFDFIDVAHPILKEIMSQMGETVHLAVYDQGDVFYVDKIEAPNTLKISSFIGKRNPAYCTGVGKCLLAFQDEAEQERVLAGEMKPYTPHTVTDPASLRILLSQVKKTRVSYDREEFENGLVCIAVPIFNRYREVCAAISVSSPTLRTDTRRLEEFKEILSRAAERISHGIGYRE